jgi:transcriptional regulator with XRE-family HTH domain
MALLMPLKSLLLSIFRLLKGVPAEDLADRSGVTVRRIGAIERAEVKEAPAAELEQILSAMDCSKAEFILLFSCLEALSGLDLAADPEKAAAHERFIASSSRRLRRRLRAPGVPDPSSYPGPHEVELDRFEARDSWDRLLPVKTLPELTLVVRSAREYPCWAFVERLCDESVRAASKDPRRALDLAIVAVRIARRLPVWELWRLRLLGFAAAHLANALRVASRLDAADRTLAAARRLWDAGLDPDRLLDPGRLLDLEASLRRDQRRFAEALDLLERATPLTRRPEHVGLNLASVLAVMGRYHRAIEVLTGLGPRVAAHPEPRLRSIQRFNLCVALSHVGQHTRAARLLPVLGRLVKDDEMDRIRFRWLEGRIAAGLGHTQEALEALAEARSGFAGHGLGYDVGLSLLETAALHLERGELGEVQRLTAELAPFFEKNDVHDEALKALRLFEEAAARQAATAELARLVLAWLFRAQDDRGLVFSPPAGSP